MMASVKLTFDEVIQLITKEAAKRMEIPKGRNCSVQFDGGVMDAFSVTVYLAPEKIKAST